jgi:hypothetical protein
VHVVRIIGGSGGAPGLRVAVVTGSDTAPVDLQSTNGPAARYFAHSGKVVHVSGLMYSSTCVPKGKATQRGRTSTLSIEPQGGSCTADAGRDTFQVEHVKSGPRRLVVVESGQPDLRLDLSS